jgi:hypothetical protein
VCDSEINKVEFTLPAVPDFKKKTESTSRTLPPLAIDVKPLFSFRVFVAGGCVFGKYTRW